MVDPRRFELLTPAVQKRCSTKWARSPQLCGLCHHHLYFCNYNLGREGFEPSKTCVGGFTVRSIWPLCNLPEIFTYLIIWLAGQFSCKLLEVLTVLPHITPKRNKNHTNNQTTHHNIYICLVPQRLFSARATRHVNSTIAAE